jgi:hypothetical protein
MASANEGFSREGCPYCRGSGEVEGTVDDVAFTFQCSCSGGSEEAVRWLLGLHGEAPSQGEPPQQESSSRGLAEYFERQGIEPAE